MVHWGTHTNIRFRLQYNPNMIPLLSFNQTLIEPLKNHIETNIPIVVISISQ